VRCETAQRAIGEAMDDQSAGLSTTVEDHARTCPICSRFEAGAWRLRELTRFEVAPPVPDMVPAIMGRIQDEVADRLLGWAPMPKPPLHRRIRARVRAVVGTIGGAASWGLRQRAALTMLVVGLVVGLVVSTGVLAPVHRVDPVALAAEIPRDLVAASAELSGYRATFDVVERNWTTKVPLRTFQVDLAFRAPERIRVEVRDTTAYPSAEWPRNDLSLLSDGRSWRIRGLDPCPAAALPACPLDEPVDRSMVRRAPFDPGTPLPTDVILPMTVLAPLDRVSVLGTDRVAGREAIDVQLVYQDASPLFDALRFLGSWRSFFPQDVVVVALDLQTWFPLSYRVFPAAGAERAAWAERMGLPPEPPDQPVFEATARSLSTILPPASLFDVAKGPGAVDERFEDLPLPPSPGTGASCSASSDPIQPCNRAGLAPYRFGRFPKAGGRTYQQSVLAFARGMTWLTVTHVVGWDRPEPYGVGTFAEAVDLSAGRGVAFYEPASIEEPRRVAIHTRQGEFLLASNLPRDRLLAVAGSLPVTGRALPKRWRILEWPGGVIREGVARADFSLLGPTFLPSGYRQAGAQTVTIGEMTGVSVAYRRPGAELDGVGLVVYQATGAVLPPPDSPGAQSVKVRGVDGRWSPDEHLLEWVQGGIYRSLTGPSLYLPTLLRVAEGLREP
jgi:hypothetical protein